MFWRCFLIVVIGEIIAGLAVVFFCLILALRSRSNEIMVTYKRPFEFSLKLVQKDNDSQENLRQ